MISSKDILIQILTEAKERNISVGVTQLVKFFYLAEVEYFRSHQERLTEIRWLFYHYGPYAMELREVLNQPEFVKEELKTRDDRDFVRCSVAEQRIPYGWKLEPKITLLIKKIVGEWSGKSLEELLDYVYFDTEPMQSVKRRGGQLDFNAVKPKSETPEVVPLKASKEAEKKVATLRARLQLFLEAMGQTKVVEPSKSDEYLAALKAWDEEENSSLAIPSNLVVHVTMPSADSDNQGN